MLLLPRRFAIWPLSAGPRLTDGSASEIAPTREDEPRNLVRNPLDSLFTQTESQRAGDPLVVRRRLSELLPYPLPPLPPAPLSGVQKKFSPSSSDPL